MFFQKFPNLLYFFLQLFLQKNFGFSWLKYFRNLPALWRVIFLRSLSCVQESISPGFSRARKNGNANQKTKEFKCQIYFNQYA